MSHRPVNDAPPHDLLAQFKQEKQANNFVDVGIKSCVDNKGKPCISMEFDNLSSPQVELILDKMQIVKNREGTDSMHISSCRIVEGKTNNTIHYKMTNMDAARTLLNLLIAMEMIENPRAKKNELQAVITAHQATTPGYRT